MITFPLSTEKLNLAKIAVKVACILCLFTQPVFGDEVTIYRDGWGVPHIYGDSDRAVAFGYGYAQAQDRYPAIARNYAESTGQLARFAGEPGLSSDFRQRLWRHREAALDWLTLAPTHESRWVEAFAAGIRHYVDQDPNRRAKWPDGVEPAHVVTLTRFLYWRAVLGQLDAEHAGLPRSDQPANGILFGLGPERTTEDATVLVADPYESWEPGRKWYEAHLHSPTLHAWGFTYPGMALPVYGHNRKAGWGWLPGGPDVGDVYRITFLSDTSSRYRWSGKIRAAQSDTFHITVREKGTRVLTGQRTHLGPIIHREGTVGFAYRVPEDLGAGQTAQLYRMLHSTGFRSFYDSLRPAKLGPATLLFGDTEGTLFYIRSGLVAIRPESVDWDRPVLTDGGSDWLGIHIQEDLIQLLDPHAGWIVDAGTPPDRTTPYSPLIPDRYPAYLYNADPGHLSARSRRLHRLIESAPRVTLNEIFEIALDTHVIESTAWLRALSFAVAESDPGWTKEEALAFSTLQAWDGRAEPDRLGPALYLSWRQACSATGRNIDERSILTASELSRQTKRHLISAFRKALVEHKTRYGHLDVRWREVHRSRLGSRSWGMPGIDRRAAKSIRRIVTNRDKVVDYASGGQSAPTVMILDPEGVRSFSAVPFGQSDNLNSPHSWDQGEVLFTQHRLKPTRFDTKPKDLIKQEVLRLPEDLSK